MTQIIDRETLNNAIHTVLTAKFKKDAREAFAAVEDAGYTIEKRDSNFWVINDETRRYVYVRENRYGPGYAVNANNFYKRFTTYGAEKVIDYVNLLNKPINMAWYNVNNNTYAPTKMKYRLLVCSRDHVKYADNEVARIQKKIDELQRELVAEIERRATYKQNLTNCRKTIGLTK